MLLLELLQGLQWWLVVPSCKGHCRNRLDKALPLDLRLRACCLNSYQLKTLLGGGPQMPEDGTHSPPTHPRAWWTSGIGSGVFMSCSAEQRDKTQKLAPAQTM